MDNPTQAKLRILTQTDEYAVAPGRKLTIPVGLVNAGEAADQIRIGVEGVPLAWVSAERQVVFLQPGGRVQILLSVQPPAPPNAAIGRYPLILKATSEIHPGRAAQTRVALTVAGFEVKGRAGVLLEGLNYSVVPGEPLTIRLVLINRGLGGDTFGLSLLDLPEGWTRLPEPAVLLQPGEVRETSLVIRPPRDPSARASRYPFRIQIASREAPDQTISIDCTLTVAAFTEFKSALEAAQPDQDLPQRVAIQNLSNIPVSFQVSWTSPEDSLAFEPEAPAPVNVPSGETAHQEYSVRPVRRPWFGGEKNYPYTVNVQASDQQTQSLEGSAVFKALLPTWVLVAGILLLTLLCLYTAWTLWSGSAQTGATTPTLPQTATAPLPTETLSPIDQRSLLIERNWFLAAFNDVHSSPGTREAFTLFNPNGTLIGYTGCKDLSANYQTNYNRISVTNLNLGPGACASPALQRQEEAMVALLRSARSYFIADTVLQIAGEAGFLNYSLTPLNRPEGITPPKAVIQAAPQSQVGQVVVFDGAASSGQFPLVSWNWDFGDGVTASGVVVQHTYANAGTFPIRLTVTDQRGQTGTTAGQIHVLPPPTLPPTPTVPAPTETPQPTAPPPEQPTAQPEPPVAPPTQTPEPPPAAEPPQANLSGPRRGYIGEPVEFDASASRPGSSPIASFRWSLGNGQDLPASAEPTASAIYNRAGDFEVTVFVQDAEGLSSYASTRITIDARLDTDVWRLSLLNASPLLPGTAITMQFKEGELAGFAGCNAYSGNFTASLNEDGSYTLVISRLRTSRSLIGRAACPQEFLDQEQAYLAILEQADRATIQQNRISVTSPAGELVFYLIEAP